MDKGLARGDEERVAPQGSVKGIVVSDAGAGGPHHGPGGPRILAFIWGGKVRPTPTLPYGRWKGAA